MAVAGFRTTVDWNSRTWQPWEKFLFSAFNGAKHKLVALFMMLPCLMLLLPFMPLISLLLLRAPPAPQGYYGVGLSDVQRLLSLNVAGVGSNMLRMRVFYPASVDGSSGTSAASWLPDGQATSRYARAHPDALPFPKRFRKVFAPLLSAFLFRARLDKRVSRQATPMPAPRQEGWPLVIFSHGMYGCASSYSALCAEIASHGAVVVALEHKDGSAVYSETDDGDVTGHVNGQDTEDQVDRRVDEIGAVLECVNDVVAEAQRGERGAVRDLSSSIEELPTVDTSRVAFVGHSFGGATALRAAAKLEREGRSTSAAAGAPRKAAPSVSAVVALDPWISGYNHTRHGVSAAPTAACLTQSMMYPPNEEALGDGLQLGQGVEGRAPTPDEVVRRRRRRGVRALEGAERACETVRCTGE